ncbi:MAG TPA: hypothetical protein VEJ18_22395 [Planctomycetota bacterium]|nr:hypothetical protein [Planctomycetota bacterium]
MKAWACAALASLAGCLSLEREAPTVRTYLPTVQVPSERPGQGTLAVGRFDVSPRFARREFVYRQTDVHYEADPYHLFLAEPGLVLREETERWMRHAGVFAHAGDPARFARADVRLEGEVEEIYGDYRQPSSPRARLAVRFLAWNADGRLLLDRGYEADVPLGDSGRPTLVRGWETGLRRILEALTADLRGVAGRPSTPPAD